MMRRKRRKLVEQQQELALKFMPMAVRIAKQMRGKFPHIGDEFESVCLLALVEAAESYDSTIGVKFQNFAYFRIKGAIKSLQRSMRSVDQIDNYDVVDERRQLDDEIEDFKLLIRELDKRQKDVMYGMFVLDMNQCEIAESLGISRGRVSYIYRVAISFLQRVGNDLHKRALQRWPRCSHLDSMGQHRTIRCRIVRRRSKGKVNRAS